ncbi:MULTISPECIES: phosphatase [unclassified Rhizobium]|uniref:phosphatase n=1 Tax=unclassified Rhizobium TaxID=2613769 RepID=UPI000713BDBB|nr:MULTISPECIES: phosphatase [unclassified Rhizobium]KQS96396.1 phosphatase [Rhizobium sp. Leaf386]KQT06235.1 phosphatase [Rhizobium sp. Leaf391]KQU09530.1 phosphatase [Rhizobium sp. Leaf453]
MALAAEKQAVDKQAEALYAPLLSTNPAHPNGWPIRIIVSSQTEARHNRALWAPTHLISIRATGSKLLSMIDLPAGSHLELLFGDVTDSDEPDAARAEAIERTFAFVDQLPQDAHLLVHCLRGIGRSTALTMGILARYMDPEEAAAALHGLRPEAKPNRHVTGLCDTVLGLKGKLAKQALRFPAKVWKPAKS